MRWKIAGASKEQEMLNVAATRAAARRPFQLRVIRIIYCVRASFAHSDSGGLRLLRGY